MRAWAAGSLACLLSAPASGHSSPPHRDVGQAFRHEYRVGDPHLELSTLDCTVRSHTELCQGSGGFWMT
jgi:hypothetical protein